MSIDNTRGCVRSKYFVAKTDMEESLSDFQESKPNCKGPKTAKKVVNRKTRKVSKHIKGQKDIRAALKEKKSDLVSYTREFDNVCKKSGVDVDSEELQLAIALSKSLQSETPDASTSQSITTQARVVKIRTTLQEYGFTVPELKATTNKRLKKHKNQYKLLNTTEEEKLSNIRYKYSAILFESLDCKKSAVSPLQFEAPIYNKASNLEYEFMKNNSVFYVDSLENLIERSNSAVGSSLKDWSEIPGRPVSPVPFDRTAMDVSEILYSQDELDIILSGAITSAHKIIATKVSKHDSSTCNANHVKTENENDNVIAKWNKRVDQENCYLKNTGIESPDIVITKYDDTDEIDTVIKSHSTDTVQHRSCSPDIFDDEIISITEISKPILSQENTKLFTEDTNCMEITECILVNNIINTTKRKSNDFMEITECAVTVSQGIKENVKGIDLTQSPEEKSVIKTSSLDDSCVHLDYKGNQRIGATGDCKNDKRHEGIDLIQIYCEDENNKLLKNNSNISCQDPIDEIIDLTQSSKEDDNKKPPIEVSNEIYIKDTNIDLTQSSKSSIDICDLPEVNVGNTQNSPTSPDDTVILNEDDYIDANGKVKKNIVPQNDQVFDLTQAGDMLLDDQANCFTKEGTSNICGQSFYEDFVHDHSDNKENKVDIKNENNNVSVYNRSTESNDIDLTQTSNESTTNNVSPEPIKAIEYTPNNSSLGKKDDISIDYDEICEHMVDNSLKVPKSQICNEVEIVDKDNDLISNSSQFSEVFDLTDQELNYSIHKSKLEVSVTNYNYDFGEISDIVNNKTCLEPPHNNKSSSLEENNLPEVNIGSSQKFVQIVHQNIDENSIRTPKNNEYIIKTDDVTPMLDYTSLTTPQRNKELEKYGLKPFKRKRAIKILTHLYNQTHPIMEPCSDDEPSASKKPKHDTSVTLTSSQVNKISPKQREIYIKSPNKNVKSPKKRISNDSKSPKTVNKNGENIISPRNEGTCSKEILSIYEVTSEVPIIRNIDGDSEDWVFQKREKAKVHTCRVPLHIAFHNYVSSRSGLREAILRYEPINIDVIHKELVLYGYRYDSKLQITCPEIIHGEVIVDRKSSFQGHAAEVHSLDDVKAVLRKLKLNKKILNAKHNMYAYRIERKTSKSTSIVQDCDDDGESHAGGRMLHLLQVLDQKNSLIICMYGWIQLGPDRFRDINNASRQALQQAGLIPSRSNK